MSFILKERMYSIFKFELRPHFTFLELLFFVGFKNNKKNIYINKRKFIAVPEFLFGV